jgi:formylglycine-generating enzyme required for sulfatase activity
VTRLVAVAVLSLAGCRLYFDELATDGGGSDVPMVDAPKGILVPGGPFFRGYDTAADALFADMSNPATVSAFRLDATEVSVARFRAFVDQGAGTQASPPTAGAGAHTAIANSGWQAGFNAMLPADAAELKTAANCTNVPTWTDAPGANEAKPINCVSWYVAFAFCIADGGYLPTEAEWNFAAAGGDEQRAYPWSQPASDTTIDCTRADFQGCGAGLTDVATLPAGNGRFGHSDLAGNVWEWTLDTSGAYPNPCTDCAAQATTTSQRIVRGGGFASTAVNLRAADRFQYLQTAHLDNVGIRCAYPP